MIGTHDLYTAIVIGLWAWLWCSVITQPEHIFGFVRKWLSEFFVRFKPESIPGMIYKALIGCPTCHAGQVSFWWQVVQFTQGNGFDISFIIISISTGTLVNTWNSKLQK